MSKEYIWPREETCATSVVFLLITLLAIHLLLETDRRSSLDYCGKFGSEQAVVLTQEDVQYPPSGYRTPFADIVSIDPSIVDLQPLRRTRRTLAQEGLIVSTSLETAGFHVDSNSSAVTFSAPYHSQVAKNFREQSGIGDDSGERRLNDTAWTTTDTFEVDVTEVTVDILSEFLNNYIYVFQNGGDANICDFQSATAHLHQDTTAKDFLSQDYLVGMWSLSQPGDVYLSFDIKDDGSTEEKLLMLQYPSGKMGLFRADFVDESLFPSVYLNFGVPVRSVVVPLAYNQDPDEDHLRNNVRLPVVSIYEN